MRHRKKNDFKPIDPLPFEWCSQAWEDPDGYSVVVQRHGSAQISAKDARQLVEWNDNCLLVYSYISNFAQKELEIETLPLHFFYHDHHVEDYEIRPVSDEQTVASILTTDPWVIYSGAKVGDELVIKRPHPRGHVMTIVRRVVEI